jgi:hypothetical protein
MAVKLKLKLIEREMEKLSKKFGVKAGVNRKLINDPFPCPRGNPVVVDTVEVKNSYTNIDT